MRPYWGVSRYGRCRLFRLPVGLSVMGVAPISPLRAACTVHGVRRVLVAAWEGVPGFGGFFNCASCRPTHTASAKISTGNPDFCPVYRPGYFRVSSAVRTWSELGAIHDVLLPPQPFWRPRASIVQDYVQSSGNSHRPTMFPRSHQFSGWGVFLRTPTKI